MNQTVGTNKRERSWNPYTVTARQQGPMMLKGSHKNYRDPAPFPGTFIPCIDLQLQAPLKGSLLLYQTSPTLTFLLLLQHNISSFRLLFIGQSCEPPTPDSSLLEYAEWSAPSQPLCRQVQDNERYNVHEQLRRSNEPAERPCFHCLRFHHVSPFISFILKNSSILKMPPSTMVVLANKSTSGYSCLGYYHNGQERVAIRRTLSIHC